MLLPPMPPRAGRFLLKSGLFCLFILKFGATSPGQPIPYACADQIVFSGTPVPSLTRTILLTNNLLNLPVKNGATMKRGTVSVGGNAVRDLNIQLAAGPPDWWAFVDVSAFSNQVATISANSLNAGSQGLSSIVQANGIVGATNLYAETLRPRLHFSTRRGWLNDASAAHQLGQFNGATFSPATQKLPGNSGSGFYASQTFTSMAPGDQRKVRLGWAIIATPGMPFNQHFKAGLTHF